MRKWSHEETRKVSPEVRERAVRLVSKCRDDHPRDETDTSLRPGVTTTARQRVKELEREVKDLRRANEILKLASAELDRRLKS